LDAAVENWILVYLGMIRAGEVTVGRWVLAVYEMIERDLAAGRYRFDARKARRAIRFIEGFVHHSKGRSDRLKLEPWQKAAVSAIFGLVDAEGLRWFREIVIIVARKNGKTLFAAAIAAYCLFLDGEYGAEIYCLAPKLDQADLVYQSIWQTVHMEPELSSITRRRKADYYVESTNSIVKKIAFNSKKSDGFNPSLSVCDEIAAWPGTQGLRQYEVMTSATGSRSQPLTLSISTAGYVSDGIYDDLVARSTRVLMGESQESRLLPILYMIDDPAKWDDLEELKKASPNLGISLSEDYLRERIAVAKGSLSAKAEFLVKFCNIKQSSSQAWLTTQAVDLCSGETLSLEDFRGSYCVGGLDLSRTTDLTAACVVIEKEGRLYVFARFWLPAARIEEAAARDNLPYGIYMQRGLLAASGDNFVDYRDCLDWFRMLVREYEILPLKVGYDRYTAQYLVQEMAAEGFHMDDVFQGFNLTPVIDETEGLMRDGVFRLGDNDLLKIHLLNMGVKIDTEQEKKKPVKIGKYDHIDGAAALLDAMTVRQKWHGEIGEQLKNAA
jgi:phage terminase large subunit-like protein